MDSALFGGFRFPYIFGISSENFAFEINVLRKIFEISYSLKKQSIIIFLYCFNCLFLQRKFSENTKLSAVEQTPTWPTIMGFIDKP